jgi:2-keto-4-pentenoate hydratase/2-oxohepta-3-ene-1,7-dioic acid hydratase in catechol pathway
MSAVATPFRIPVRGSDCDPVEIGAVYTVGLNYRDPDSPDAAPPERPLIYGKASSSLIGDGATISWDRTLTQNVDGECELGVVIGPDLSVLGYTIVNDVTSQDPWLDGDQWLLGKSMPGFCPAGPLVVPADELDPADLGVGLSINGVCVQHGRTSQMRFSIPELVAYLGAHVALRPGDLIATGTPKRIGPDAARHLQPGDQMTCSIESIGTLTTTVA